MQYLTHIPAPLKLRPYGAIQICLLLLLSFQNWSKEDLAPGWAHICAYKNNALYGHISTAVRSPNVAVNAAISKLKCFWSVEAILLWYSSEDAVGELNPRESRQPELEMRVFTTIKDKLVKIGMKKNLNKMCKTSAVMPGRKQTGTRPLSSTMRPQHFDPSSFFSLQLLHATELHSYRPNEHTQVSRA